MKYSRKKQPYAKLFSYKYQLVETSFPGILPL